MDIAVIGMACRFPGAPTYQQFWQNLAAGVDSITEVPQERWDWRAHWGDPQSEQNKTNSKWGGFIEDIDTFDPRFFAIAPQEANYMDPQHRIVLEAMWHAIEDAGYRATDLSGQPISVYIGVSKNDYAELMRANQQEIVSFISTGTVHSILANRISYLLNLRGKSETIDAACASSLVALHHAMRDIQLGECEAALVGGVNALLTPTMYISHAKSGMLSPDGRCKTFDAQANGYVRGEGVGAIFLKPLMQALADQDHILGVIKGVAVNHGGRAHSMTAPNVNAQAEVIEAAIRNAQIPPETITYIEAHGTATPLGDPVEIEGLTKAFQRVATTNDTHRCGLGSVKTNIGHLESAAGMAGLIKVLLCLQHGQLPPSLHFQQPNPYIELDGTPFFIVDQLTEWTTVEQEGQNVPRRAGLSSFGMGGVNAHLIVEEAPALRRDPVAAPTRQPTLIPLSAKTEAALHQSATELCRFLNTHENIYQLPDIAFTCQTGREEMAHRVIFLADDLPHLQQLLRRFIDKRPAEQFWRGQVTTAENRLVPITTADAHYIAAQWVKGASVDWHSLPQAKGYRIPLPGYSFERRRCWFATDPQPQPNPIHTDARQQAATESAVVEEIISLHETDYFLRDHQVRGERVLPGVAYFDLLRAVVAAHDDRPIRMFKEIHWLTPLVVNGAVDARVTMDNGSVTVTTGTTTHMSAQVAFTAFAPLPRANLAAIRERCPYSVQTKHLYEQFMANGLTYGETFQVIEACHYNEREVLCCLHQSPQVATDHEQHFEPSILDGVFQAVVALNILGDITYTEQYLPFQLASVCFYQTLPSVAYAHVYTIQEASDPQNLIFAMRLYDEEGNIIATFDRFVKRPLPKQRPVSEWSSLYTYTSSWVNQQLTMHRETLSSLVIFDENDRLVSHLQAAFQATTVVLVQPGQRFQKIGANHYTVNPADPTTFHSLLAELAAYQLAIDSILYKWDFEPCSEVQSSIDQGILPLLYLAQALMATKQTCQESVQIVYLYRNEPALQTAAHALIGGFARTLAYENPQLALTSVGVEVADDTEAMADALAQIVDDELTHYAHPPLHEVIYQRGVRKVRTMVETQHFWDETAESMLRPRGCYLITGGTGGIGRILARHLAQHFHATVVLVGRTQPNAPIDALLAELAALGGKGLYFAADVTQTQVLQEVMNVLEEEQIELQGVIHGAGFIDDAYILHKTASSFAQVLAPKVVGTMNLDAATQAEPLDFFMVLSSIAALMPNQGQSDYAAANSFLDSFVAQRNQLWRAGKRSGLGISINWPLWAEGGIGVTDEIRDELWHVFGIKPLTTATGLAIFEKSLRPSANPPNDHLVAMEGTKQKIDAQMKVDPQPTLDIHAAADDFTKNSQQLKQLINQVLLHPQSIGDNDSFADLGFDSVGLVALAEQLNDQFGITLKPSIFFELQTVAQLVEHLHTSASTARSNAHADLPVTSLIDRAIPDSHKTDTAQFTYQKTLNNDEFFMRDHVVAGKFNVPGACYIEMARQAGALAVPDQFVYKLTANYWAKQLSSTGSPIQITIQLTSSTDAYDYEMSCLEDGNKVVYAVGQLHYCSQETLTTLKLGSMDLDAIKARCPMVRKPQAIYQQIIAEGLHVGPTFQPMTEIFLSADEALAQLRLPETLNATLSDYLLHPSLLTGVLQTALLNNQPDGIVEQQHIPIAIDEIILTGRIPADCAIYTCRETAQSQRGVQKFAAKVLTPTGDVVATLSGIALRSIATAQQIHRPVTSTSDSPSQATALSNQQVIQVEHLLKEITSPGIGLLPAELDSHTSFDAFGISSVMIMDLNQRLSTVFGNLSKTLFFEHKNFHELATYFYTHHAVVIAALIAKEPEELVAVSTTNATTGEEALPTNHAAKPQGVSERIQANHQDADQVSTDDIAIIGMAGRYPGAENLAEFWTLLKEGRDCITAIPTERFADTLDEAAYPGEPHPADRLLTGKWGSFIDGVDHFDPLFFNISPREATLIDPQERLFLQVVWETLEDAGYTRARVTAQSNNVGVFVGALWQPYVNLGVEETARGNIMGPSGLLYSIPNRVSHFFDWIGPSLAIDTACSSSLTALHYACESLRHQECDSAIAGGVNLSLTTSKYLFLSRNGFLSSDGRCRSFGAGGDGYVPGEGIGSVYLKRLTDAIRDGDRVLAVIKATTVNHGGKTHGYTVPNPTQQADLIAKALEKSGIHARTISYVEAHGTGTALGDPIEITGLQRAFANDTDDTQFCAIGSVKSNIGHLEAAAGIAGLTKILLQLKHGMLVPSLHAEQLNPNIDFTATPFFVQRGLTTWKRHEMTENGEQQSAPRHALLSSFGAGGANAHAVIAEYMAINAASVDQPARNGPQLILISAKNAARLRDYVQKLQNYLATEPADALADIAYTLQVGREAMAARLAIIAEDLADLRTKLNRYLTGSHDETKIYQSQPAAQQGKLDILAEVEVTEEIVAQAMTRGKLASVAQLWVTGVDIDWHRLYATRPSQTISLPTYPFARERYWLPRAERSPNGDTSSNRNSNHYSSRAVNHSDGWHPLVQQNRSTLAAPRFVSRFHGNEFFFKDHRVQGERLFPAVAYLEMARAAGESAVEDQSVIQLMDVVWLRPLAHKDEPLTTEIELQATEDDALSFVIGSRDSSGEPLPHCQGQLGFGVIETDEEVIDLEAIRQRCPEMRTGEACYRRFEAQGLSYGPTLQVIDELISNDNEALARLRLPVEVNTESYQFHPSLLDGVLQSAIGLLDNGRDPSLQLYLPFALERLEILGPLNATGYAYVTLLARQPESAQFNLALLDEMGRVVLKFHRLTLKPIALQQGTWYYHPIWNHQPLSIKPKAATAGDIVLVMPKTCQAWGDGLVQICQKQEPQRRVIRFLLGDQTTRLHEFDWEIDLNDETGVRACFSTLSTVDTIYFLDEPRQPGLDPTDLNGVTQGQPAGILALFRLLKALEWQGLMTRLSALKVVTTEAHQLHPQEAIQPWSAALPGLTMSLAKEYPTLDVSCIDVTPAKNNAEQLTLDPADVGAIVAEQGNQGQPVLLRQGVRYVRQLIPLTVPAVKEVPYRQGGVYLILGGAGGIGLETAVHLAEQARAKVVLVGRRALTDTSAAELNRIRMAGGDYLYCQADGTDLMQMDAVVQQTKAKFGAINGVIHSALILDDRSISAMDEATLQAVLAPKVTGSLVLAEVVKEEPLDFMLFFSSTQSFWGNAGQSNYAAACTFADAYASYLGQTRPYPVKTIHWGYWGDVGVVATETYRLRLAEQGIHSISIAEGMAALDQMMASPLTHVAAVKADRATLATMGVNFSRRSEIMPSISPSVTAETVATAETMQRLRSFAEKFTPNQPEWQEEEAGFAALETFAVMALHQAFQQLGLLPVGDELHSPQNSIQPLPIVSRYQRFYVACLHILASAGHLNAADSTSNGNHHHLLLDSETVARQEEMVASRFPLLRPHLQLLTTCLQALPAILRGETLATDVIFPNSSLALIADIYQGTLRTDVHNTMVARAVKAYIEQRLTTLNLGETIRIVEIGAGTGGTTDAVLRAIKPYEAQIDYLYTDISQSFLQHGQQRFGADYPFVRFGLLDIEQALGTQRVDVDHAEIVLGTNVVHATRNIQQTVQHLKTLLKPHGLLILNEATRFSAFTTLTFGLLDGWWAFEDEAQRIDHTPLLAVTRWKQVLQTAGFQHVQAIAHTAIENSDQVVLLAESDGLVQLPTQESQVKDSKPTSKVSHRATNPPPMTEAKLPLLVESTQEGVEWTLTSIVSEQLQIPTSQIETDLPYRDFGVDSILAVEIINQINRQLNITLRTTDLFNYADIQTLTAHILATFPEELAQSALSHEARTPSGQPTERLFAPKNYTPKTFLSQPLFTANGNGNTKNQNQAPTINSVELHQHQPMDIAIIGLSCRFPGAEDATAFWQNLAAGHNAISDATAQRWPANDFYSAERNRPGKSISKWAGLLVDIDCFDPQFFNLSPREAELMDPQQRLFLQEAWAALEDAGYATTTLTGQRCGVFVGCTAGDYQHQLVNETVTEAYSFMGNSTAILAARIAYHLNLTGPSIAIDTACSSSLVALHLACESIQLGTSELAIAGGVSILTTPAFHILASQTGMLSPQGQCQTFAQGADGFVPSEGVGVVVLKPLAQAIADGDHIYGAIKGSAINQDGKTNGITAPNGPAQTALATRVYEQYGIEPTTISYVEAHGTGTALGDPIEVAALSDAFRQYSDKTGYCAIGSVKSNIGHALAAAGIAGLIKVLLAFKHGKLPPSLHFTQPNEHIDFAHSPFTVNTTLSDWVVQVGPRRAAISSFGFSGTNAHLVVEEHQGKGLGIREQGLGVDEPQVIVLSAKSEERLRVYAQRLLAYFGLRQSNDADASAKAMEPTGAIKQTATITQNVQQRIAELLRVEVDEIDPSQPLESYGLDTVQLNHLKAALEEQYSCELPLTLMSMQASVQAVAAEILSFAVARTDAVDCAETTAMPIASPPSLADIAYTLQVGREAMDVRLAFVAETITDASKTLSDFLAGQSDGCYQGNQQTQQQQLNLLTEGDEAQAFVEAVIQRGKLDKVAQLWVSGVEIDWSLLHHSGKPKRISLPTYPFAKQRYWLPDATKEELPSAIVMDEPLQNQDDNPLLCFSEQWIAQALSTDGVDWVEAIRHQRDIRILVLYAEQADGAAMRTLLTQIETILHNTVDNENGLHYQFVRLTASGTEGMPSEDATLPISDQAAIARWIKALKGNDQLPDLLFILSSHSECTGSTHDFPTSNTYQDQISFVFHIIQGFMQQSWGKPLRGYYLFAQDDDSPRVALEALSGLMRTAALENPAHLYQSIQVDSTLTSEQKAVVLLHEWLLGNSLGTTSEYLPMVRYQGGNRYVTALQETVALSTHAETGFRSRAVYLIVGGLGEIGYQLCRYLSESYQSTLVILARSRLDETKRRQIEQIEQGGGKVCYYPVDITDRPALHATMTQVKEDVGPIAGVIHLAVGVNDDLTVNKSFDSFLRVMGPKVEGTLYLDEVTQDEPLEFFMLFSSMAAFGVKGSPDYAYANAFQNAFAQWRAQQIDRGQRRGRTRSLCWGQWVLDHYSTAERNELLRQKGFELLAIETGLAAIEQTLQQEETVLAITAFADGEKARRTLSLQGNNVDAIDTTVAQIMRDLADDTKDREQIFQRAAAVELQHFSDEQIAILHEQLTRHAVTAESSLNAVPIEPLVPYQPLDPATLGITQTAMQPTDVRRVIQTVLQAVLKLDDESVNPQVDFQTYGMDSITGMQMATLLEQALGMEVRPRWLIDSPTIDELAKKLLQTHEVQHDR